jgi:hypothetical protein
MDKPVQIMLVLKIYLSTAEMFCPTIKPEKSGE